MIMKRHRWTAGVAFALALLYGEGGNRWDLQTAQAGAGGAGKATKPSSGPPTLEQARERGKQAHKTLLLMFVAKWCGVCKEFDQLVLSQASVERGLGEVVFVRYDAEAGTGVEAARALKIIGYPTFVALAQDGREIERLQGALGPKKFLAWVERVSVDSESDEALIARSQGKDGAAEALLTLGRRQVRRGQEDQGIASLERARTMTQGGPGGDRVGAAADFALRVLRLRRLIRQAPIKEMAEHVLAFPQADSADTAMQELAKRGRGDALTQQAMAHYVGVRLASRAAKDLDALNAAVYQCLRTGVPEAAEKAARRLVEIDGESPYYLDTLAEVLHLRGEKAQALALSAKAVTAAEKAVKRGENPEILTLLQKNQARYARGQRELPAELLAEEDLDLSPWEQSTP